MYSKYFILTIALVSSISYTMDEDPAKVGPKGQPRKQKKESLALATKPKNPCPTITQIIGFDTLITFNKQTQSLYIWINDRQNNKFGDTPILLATSNSFNKLGNITDIAQHENFMERLAFGLGFYTSNIFKKYSDSTKKKYIRYGAIVAIDKSVKIPSKQDAPRFISTFSQHFLAELLMKGPDKFFAEDKNKQEITQ